MFAKLATIVFGLAAAANAYTVANQSGAPSGNSIEHPAKGETVTAGKTFDVTWDPTSGGTVTIYLCVGPSTDCVNQAVPFANAVANTGSFAWSVPTDIAPSTTAGEGFGVMIISDQTPTIYNWSPQFGISNPSYSGSSSSSVVVSTGSVSSSAAPGSSSSGASATATSKATVVSSSSAHATSVGTISSVATGSHNSTVLQPTSPMTVPSSLKTSAATHAGTATTSTPLAATGAAGMVRIGFGAVVGGVVAAIAL